MYICLITLCYLQVCRPTSNAVLSVKEKWQVREQHQVVRGNSSKSVETPTSCDYVELQLSQCRNSFCSSFPPHCSTFPWQMASSLIDLQCLPSSWWTVSLPWWTLSSLPQQTGPPLTNSILLNKWCPPLTNSILPQQMVSSLTWRTVSSLPFQWMAYSLPCQQWHPPLKNSFCPQQWTAPSLIDKQLPPSFMNGPTWMALFLNDGIPSSLLMNGSLKWCPPSMNGSLEWCAPSLDEQHPSSPDKPHPSLLDKRHPPSLDKPCPPLLDEWCPPSLLGQHPLPLIDEWHPCFSMNNVLPCLMNSVLPPF